MRTLVSFGICASLQIDASDSPAARRSQISSAIASVYLVSPPRGRLLGITLPVYHHLATLPCASAFHSDVTISALHRHRVSCATVLPFVRDRPVPFHRVLRSFAMSSPLRVPRSPLADLSSTGAAG